MPSRQGSPQSSGCPSPRLTPSPDRTLRRSPSACRDAGSEDSGDLPLDLGDSDEDVPLLPGLRGELSPNRTASGGRNSEPREQTPAAQEVHTITRRPGEPLGLKISPALGILEVDAGSPAEVCGLRVGMVVDRVDGHAVACFGDVRARLQAAGTEVRFHIRPPSADAPQGVGLAAPPPSVPQPSVQQPSVSRRRSFDSGTEAAASAAARGLRGVTRLLKTGWAGDGALWAGLGIQLPEVRDGRVQLPSADLARIAGEAARLEQQLQQRRAREQRAEAALRERRKRVEVAESRARRGAALRDEIAKSQDCRALAAAEQTLRQQEKEREEDLAGFRQSRAALRVAVADMRQRLVQLGGDPGRPPDFDVELEGVDTAALEKETGELRALHAEMRRRLRTQEAAEERLDRELRERAEAVVAHGQERVAVLAELEEWTERKQQREAELQQLQAALDADLERYRGEVMAATDHLRTHGSAADREVSQLAQECAALAAVGHKLEKEGEELRRQNKALSRQAKEMRRLAEELAGRVEGARQSVEAARQDIERAQAMERSRDVIARRFAKAKAAAAQLRQRAQRAEESAEEKRKAADERGAALSAALLELDALRAGRAEAEQEAEALAQHRDRAAALRGELAAEHEAALQIMLELRQQEGRLEAAGAEERQAMLRAGELRVELGAAEEHAARLRIVLAEAGERSGVVLAAKDAAGELSLREAQAKVGGLKRSAREAAQQLAALEKRLARGQPTASVADSCLSPASRPQNSPRGSSLGEHGGPGSPDGAPSYLQLCEENQRLQQQLGDMQERCWAAGEVRLSVERELRARRLDLQRRDHALIAFFERDPRRASGPFPGMAAAADAAGASPTDRMQEAVEELMFQNIKLRDRTAKLSCELAELRQRLAGAAPGEDALAASGSVGPEFLGSAAYAEL